MLYVIHRRPQQQQIKKQNKKARGERLDIWIPRSNKPAMATSSVETPTTTNAIDNDDPENTSRVATITNEGNSLERYHVDDDESGRYINSTRTSKSTTLPFEDHVEANDNLANTTPVRERATNEALRLIA